MPTTLIFSDSFGGTNGPLNGRVPDQLVGDSWSVVLSSGTGLFQITSNQFVNWATGNGVTGNNVAVANTTPAPGNRQIATMVGTWGGISARAFGPAVRATAAQHYAAGWVTNAFNNSTVNLYRNGVIVGTSITGVPTTDANISIEANGSTITVSVGGVVGITYVDPSPLSGGKPGIWCNGGTFTLVYTSFMAYEVTATVNTQAVGGNLSFSGSLTGGSFRLRAMAGNLSFSGALARKLSLSKSLGGNLSFFGTLFQRALHFRALTGSLNFSGALTRFASFFRAFTGNLSFNGILALLHIPGAAQVALAGVLSFTGALQRAFTTKKDVAGNLDFQGSLTKTSVVGRQLDGFLSFLGDLGTAFTAAPRRFVVALFAQLTVVHNRLRR